MQHRPDLGPKVPGGDEPARPTQVELALSAVVRDSVLLELVRTAPVAVSTRVIRRETSLQPQFVPLTAEDLLSLIEVAAEFLLQGQSPLSLLKDMPLQRCQTVVTAFFYRCVN